jgi:hypothetical protein
MTAEQLLSLLLPLLVGTPLTIADRGSVELLVERKEPRSAVVS